jgi:aminopeptidase
MDHTDVAKLARQFIGNTLEVQGGETVHIEYQGPKAELLALECATEVAAYGARYSLSDTGSAFINKNIAGMPIGDLESYGRELLEWTRGAEKYLRIRDDDDMKKVILSEDIRKEYKKAILPALDYRVNHLRWLLVAAPTEAFATLCGQTMEQFEHFYLDVCLPNYGAMREPVEPLKELMIRGKEVTVVSPKQGTNLTFSIEGIGARPCVGKRNIPDGECYTAPVKNSINGVVSFGPSTYDGHRFSSIQLMIKDGRIETAEAENAERSAQLNTILDTDPGARYFGEFAISFNPYIWNPVGSILFDEKIAGAFHMAAGSCYGGDTDNGNKSAVHFDLVQIQRPEYGGGEIWIDDSLIRKDGLFVMPELEPLNPENLAGAMSSGNSCD